MKALQTANALAMLIISLILSGALYFQFGLNEDPCPLCLLQRLGMFGILFGLSMNIFFGFKPTHFALVIFSSLVGLVFSTRQVLLHICPISGEPEGYGTPIFGMYLYSWGVLIFVASILCSAIFLMCLPKKEDTNMTITKFNRIMFYVVVLLLTINVIATFNECLIGPCCENGPCP